MFNRNLKLTFLFVVLLVVTLFFFLNTKTICNNEYWEIAKGNKKIENIKVCIKEHNVDAAIFLSIMYANGDKVEKNHHKAISVIKEFAESGNSLAMIQLADLYSSYGKKYTDYEQAEELYKKAINNQDNYSDSAKLSLARFYARKYHRTKDAIVLDHYKDWIFKIADEGNTEAMRMVASDYVDGNLLDTDYYESLFWFKKAAAKGDTLAYRSIGNLYVNGFLGDADYKEANYWFQKAASNGDDIAAELLEMNPNPFGLEITKATISDFKKVFTNYKKSNKPNPFNGGHTYFVSPKYIPLENVVDDVVFVFNKNNILEAVLIVFNKNQYIELQSYLKSKYNPLIEGANTMFTRGVTEIALRDLFEFFSVRSTSIYNLKVCTLIYKSRAFSLLIYRMDDFLRKQEEANNPLPHL